MNKSIKRTIAAFAFAMPALAFAGTPIEQSALPKAAQTFITKHFAKETVRKVEQDQGRHGMEYEVDFASGAEVEFKSTGDWKDVKAARGNAVPSAIVPTAIAQYVATNFEGLTIVEISRKRGGYEVELSNDTELKLTEDGKPLPACQGKGQGQNRGKGKKNKVN